MKSIELTYVNSNREQICDKCHAKIPARTESIKMTKKWRGRCSLTDTRYICLKCDAKGAENRA